MIPEREREALMRLTMCAREECDMCKYKDTCGFDFQYETATRCMNILAEALRKLNSSEKPNNCKDEPQTYVINPQEPTNNDKCFECDDFFTCGGQCNKIEDEPMKTTDYCDICKRDMCEDCIADATNPYCVPSHYEISYEPKDEPQTDCDRYAIVNDEGERAYNCIGCQTDCAWK